MQENILEHTTSIAGLTCKPLSILSETISPQEMNMARGGNDNPENYGAAVNELEKSITYSCTPGCQCDTCNPPEGQAPVLTPDFSYDGGGYGTVWGSSSSSSSESETTSNDENGEVDVDEIFEDLASLCSDEDNLEFATAQQDNTAVEEEEEEEDSWYEEFVDEWDAVWDMMFDPDIDDLSWMY